MKLLQNKKYIAFYILAVFIILAFFYSYATASVNTYPTEGWQISTPEEQACLLLKLRNYSDCKTKYTRIMIFSTSEPP